MTINTQKLRDLIRQACPLPWMLATSNSWRRIVDPYHVPVCSPCNQPDGHPDLAFPGGPEGPTATLLIEAANALPGLLDTLDAQTAGIAGLKSQIEMLEACAAGDAALTEGQQREIARLRGLVAEMAEHGTYETEYDGRMYSICHGCGAQDDEEHRDPNCLYVRARATLSGETHD